MSDLKNEIVAASINLDIMAKHHKVVRVDSNLDEALEFTDAYNKLSKHIYNALEILKQEEKGE